MSTATANFANENGASLPLKTLMSQYLQYWYAFVLSVALAMAGAYWYLQHATPIYQVSATLLIKDNPKSLSDDILNEGGQAQQTNSIENEIELLKSASLLQRAINAPGLMIGYFAKARIGSDRDLYASSPVTILTDSLRPEGTSGNYYVSVLNDRQFEWQDSEQNVVGTFNFGQPLTTPTGTIRVVRNSALPLPDDKTVRIQFYTPEKVAGRYKSSLKVGLLNQNSTILKLTLEDALPPRGKLVMGRILDEYRRSKLAEKDHEITTTIQFIDDRLKLISGELQSVEQNVESYRQSENITDLSQEGQLFLNGVNNNDAKINETDVQLSVLDGVNEFLKNSRNGTTPASLSDPLLLESLRKLSDLQAQQEKYARSMQPENPVMKGLESQIATVKTAIQENVDNQRQNLRIARQNLERQNNRYSSAIRTIPRKERQFINIKRQQGIKESLYLLLLQKKEEAALTYASSMTDSQIIDAPTSAGYPLRPNPKNIYLVAILAGLLVPVGGIVVRNLLSSKVKSRKDIEAETGMAVFGEIMRKPKGLKDTIIDINSNRVIAEQFKMLRANMPFIDAPDAATGGQVMLVTSSTVGEGKSFFSGNMAFNLAQLNKRVAILELDLRNPKTTQYLGMTDGQQIGLSDYLNGEATLDAILRPTPLSPNLSLISSGPLPSNPSELLSNGNLTTMLTDLRQRFDYIVLDTPPVAFVADTIIMAPHADISFYIVRQSYTPRNYMQLLSGLEANNKFKSLHVIFNGVEFSPAKDAEYGYGYIHTKTK